MTWQNHPWENIYKKDGRVLIAPFPGFDEVVRIFRENSCSHILDLGCGSGRHSVHLVREGFSVLGADISLSGLMLANAWAWEEVEILPYVQIDMREALPFATSIFDSVFSTQVIHHARLEEIRRTIEEIHRVMQTNGFAFITVTAQKDEGCTFEEIEPATYVPQSGAEAGLPHHVFTESDLLYEFRTFEVLEISKRSKGKILAIWIKKQ
jgi:SAM-dependent methyltransferase